MNTRCRYTIEKETAEAITIRDVGHRTHCTVTNDAEHVVRELADRLGARKLYYYDSEGNLDEIVVDGGVFEGFRAGGPH